VVIIFVERWDPLAIRIDSLASVNAPINTFEISFVEPYNKFLVGTKNGKVLVYNKKNFNAFSQEAFGEETPTYTFMDSFNMVDFIANGFSEIDSKSLTLDHYYKVQKKEIVQNHLLDENLVEAAFLPTDMTQHVSIIRSCNKVFFRSFELH